MTTSLLTLTKRRSRILSLLVFFCAFFFFGASVLQAQLISEFEPNPGGDDPSDVSFEISGTPDAAFSGWVLSVEDDGNNGLVDRAAEVSGTFDANGILVVTIPDLENPSFTVILTDDFTGAAASTDLDTNNNGEADDISALGTILDAVSIVDDETETAYAGGLGGVDIAYSGSEPGLAFREASTGDWYVVNALEGTDVLFDATGSLIDVSSFDTDPTTATTFGSVNPAIVPPSPIIRFVEVDPVGENVIIKNLGGAEADISAYNICLGPGSYDALSEYASIEGDLSLEPDEEVIIDITSSTGNVVALSDEAEGLGLFLDDSDFSSSDPAQLLDYIQWGAADQDRVGQAVTAGRWDNASNFVDGEAPYTFDGEVDDFGSSFWLVGGSFTLQLLHYADVDGSEEIALDAVDEFSALVNAFQSDETLGPNTLTVHSGDIIIPGPRYFAAEDSRVRATTGSNEPGNTDVAWANEFGVQAATVGNHELDFGTGDFYDGAFQLESNSGVDFPGSGFPWLSANIDFSTDEAFNGDDGDPAVIGVDGANVENLKNNVAKHAVININGQQIGIVGAASPTFPNITNTSDLTFTPALTESAEFTLEALAAEIQPSVDALETAGVDKIILLAHMQSIEVEKDLAEILDGVDIIVAGGSNTRMGNLEASGLYTSELGGDEEFDEPYPFQATDAGGDPVVVVNVDGDFKYLGRLVVEFNGDGIINLESIDPSESSSFASIQENVIALEGVVNETVEVIRDSLQVVIDEFSANVTGSSAVYLEGRRSKVRTEETNLGNLSADANLWYANLLDDTEIVDISLKNGGGIRAQIGSAIIPPGSTDPDETIFRAPRDLNVSQLDLAGVFRFNNGLTRLTVTATELKDILENGVSQVEDVAGRFPQISGMMFEYDLEGTARTTVGTGDRVKKIIVTGADGDMNDLVVEDGVIQGDANRTFNMVTLDFLAGGQDGYPFDVLSAPNRFDYEGAELEANDPNSDAFDQYVDTGSEQDAISEYLAAFHPETNPFAEEETPPSEDKRIVNLAEVPNTDPDLPLFTNTLDINLQGTFQVPGEVFDESAAEIPAFDAARNQIFFTDGNSDVVHVLDATDITNLTLVTTLELSGGPNSVAVFGDIVAVAVEADDKTDPGKVEFWDAATLAKLGEVTVGALPDMVTFNEDGTKVLTANEGEPSDDYLVDPEGSVSIVTLDTENLSNSTVQTATFDGVLIPEGVRIFGRSDNGSGDAATGGDDLATASEDMEPEYITVSGGTAYVTCQENNALAIVDIETATITSVVALGTEDHMEVGNGIDASDRDNEINIAQWPVKGMYMPDAISSFVVADKTYLVTANEGDAREYIYETGEVDEEGDPIEVDAFLEEERVKDLDLDPTAFPDAELLQEDDAIGRLTVTTIDGDTDGDGDYDELYAYGTRSFTIWDAATGDVVWDSKNALEQITAQRNPLFFNSTNDENNFDNRSDNKGPEPEGVTLGTIGANTYAFVGLERVGGIVVYDVTNPNAPEFAGYVNNRNFNVDEDGVEAGLAGDLAPEGLVFVSAEDSPTSTALLIVTNEVSGTVSVYEVGEAVASDFSLAILHNSDGESQVLPSGDNGGVARFIGLMHEFRDQAEDAGQEVVVLSSGDNFLAGPEFDASLSLPENERFYDAIGVEKIGYDALVLGNHDFDFGPDVLERFITDTDNGVDEPTTFLSANLDFANEAGLKALEDAERIASTITVTKGGEEIGIIGLTTPNLPFISSPRDVTIDSDLVTVAQAEIDALELAGVNKIILISHLQGIEEELALVEQLDGLDVVIAGGGDDLLANTNSVLLPGDEVEGDYPTIGKDLNDDDVYFISTAGNYEYIGRLVVNFDANGDVVSIGDNSGTFAVIPQLADVDPVVKALIEDPVRAHLEELGNTVIATSDVGLDGIRSNIRGEETNLGNLITDAYLWQAEQVEVDFELADQPRIAIQNGGGIRNDNIIAPGELTALNTFEILPFDNKLAAVEDVTPAQLKNILENAVARIVTVDPTAEGGPTEASGSGTGRFAQMSGVSVVFDPTAAPIAYLRDEDDNLTGITSGERIVSATLEDGTAIIENGELVDGAPDVTILTADFTARGGDEFPFVNDTFEQLPFTILGGVQYQQVLRNYIEAEDGLNGTVSESDFPEEGDGRIIPLLDIILAKKLDEERGVAVSGIINTNDYGFNDGQFYVQDETAGINIFSNDVGGENNNTDPLLFEAGDEVMVVGAFGSFSEQLQVSADEIMVLSEGNEIPASVAVNGADLTVDSPLQGSRVILEGVTIADASGWPIEEIGSGSGVNITATAEDGTNFIIRIDRGQSFYDASEAPNGAFTLEGTLGRFSSDPQVFPFFQGDVNTAPTTNELENRTEDEGFGTFTIDLATIFEDQYDDVLTFSAFSATEGTATVDVAMSTLTVTEVALGTTDITVTAIDEGELTTSTTFTLTVNAAPTVANEIADQTVTEGEVITVDVSGAFTDAEGDAITITATSSSSANATVSVSGTTLTINGVAEGSATITVTATSIGGTVNDAFDITVEGALGLDELKGLTLYPVPATSTVTISHESLIISKVNIVGIGGRLIRSGLLENGRLDISDLEAGSYILELIDVNTAENIRVRIIKQ